MISVRISDLKMNTITFDLKEAKNKHNKCIKIVFHWNLHGNFEKFLWTIKSQSIFTYKSNCSLSNQSWNFEHLKLIVTRWIFFSFFRSFFIVFFFLITWIYFVNITQIMAKRWYYNGTVFLYSRFVYYIYPPSSTFTV